MTALDKILHLAPGSRAVALRNVTGTLTVFDSHFPRFPVLPGVLILDDIVRTARLAAPPAPQGVQWELAGVQRIRYRHFAEPGDQLEISVDVTAATARSVSVKAVVRVGGRDITTVRELRLQHAGTVQEAS
ncbi:3-hydroxyacyl-ACP dehydratase FabZ family protein [Streptomyces sp. NPDC048603]|uniref:3-hydroxyacyl-ACP dehydratase FabZ family protein n=1 Tax=Streptomyces sp. NPDC048603 TaxID=3365577 RepID=UPI0037122D12